MKRGSAAFALWGWPIVLGVLAAIGLFCGLWGDGVWDGIGWLGVGIPTLAAVWFGLFGRHNRGP